MNDHWHRDTLFLLVLFWLRRSMEGFLVGCDAVTRSVLFQTPNRSLAPASSPISRSASVAGSGVVNDKKTNVHRLCFLVSNIQCNPKRQRKHRSFEYNFRIFRPRRKRYLVLGIHKTVRVIVPYIRSPAGGGQTIS